MKRKKEQNNYIKPSLKYKRSSLCRNPFCKLVCVEAKIYQSKRRNNYSYIFGIRISDVKNPEFD